MDDVYMLIKVGTSTARGLESTLEVRRAGEAEEDEGARLENE